tara:strand:- start:1311 stop:1583 length:273 start_codon:yes stop_codon:yes gene_type:complete
MYHKNLLSLCDNALLHLYIVINGIDGFVSQPVRNAILVKFLKPKMKSPEYKLIKKDIKTFLIAGRKKELNLEAKLNELKELSFIAVHGNK